MRKIKIIRSHKQDIDFFGIAILTTLGLINICQIGHPYHELNLSAILSYSVFSSSVIVLILKAFGYFGTLRFVPRKSDFFMFAAITALVSIFSFYGFILFVDLYFISPKKILIYTPVLSLIIFSTHYLVSVMSLRIRPRKILLKLLPNEVEKIVNEFGKTNLSQYIEFTTTDQIAEANGGEVDLMIISRAAARNMAPDEILLTAHLEGVPTLDRRRVLTELSERVSLSEADLWNYILTARPQTLFSRAFFKLKIIVEPISAAIFLLALSPLFLVLSVLIKLTSRGPVFYKQTRVGFKGENFTLIKFRSMRIDSESDGHQWAQRNDNRITRLGKFIRKTRLDELPQLWNVLKGEMGFIGPRPERPEFYQDLKEQIPLFPLRNFVRPGITGWAQVLAGYAASVEESKTKLEYDLFYIQNMSPRLDLIVVFKTIKVMLLGSEYRKIQSARHKDAQPRVPGKLNLKTQERRLLRGAAKVKRPGLVTESAASSTKNEKVPLGS